MRTLEQIYYDINKEDKLKEDLEKLNEKKMKLYRQISKIRVQEMDLMKELEK